MGFSTQECWRGLSLPSPTTKPLGKPYEFNRKHTTLKCFQWIRNSGHFQKQEYINTPTFYTRALTFNDNTNVLYYLFICLYRAACGILVPRPSIESLPPAGEAWNLNPWMARGVPSMYFSSGYKSTVCILSRDSSSERAVCLIVSGSWDVNKIWQCGHIR